MIIKPWVYIASPYTKGDVSVNTRFQCETWDRLMNDAKVWPIAPLWSHFQHTIFPRPYQDWIAYDLALIPKLDACLRLDSKYDKLNYNETKSSGADGEVKLFTELNKPVFYTIEDLYKWVGEINEQK